MLFWFNNRVIPPKRSGQGPIQQSPQQGKETSEFYQCSASWLKRARTLWGTSDQSAFLAPKSTFSCCVLRGHLTPVLIQQRVSTRTFKTVKRHLKVWIVNQSVRIETKWVSILRSSLPGRLYPIYRPLRSPMSSPAPSTVSHRQRPLIGAHPRVGFGLKAPIL